MDQEEHIELINSINRLERVLLWIAAILLIGLIALL